MHQFKLPYPPSINHYYGVRKGGFSRFIKTDGVAFRAIVAMATKGVKYGDDAICLTVELWSKDRRKRDIDNGLKCLLDSLTHAGVWCDDSQIVDLRVRKMGIDDAKVGYCVVKIERATEAQLLSNKLKFLVSGYVMESLKRSIESANGSDELGDLAKIAEHLHLYGVLSSDDFCVIDDMIERGK